MTPDFDLIIIGGGIGGATLGRGMALAGRRVLIVEKETQFKDRVRGEAIHPWGVAELQALGVYDLLRTACGHELRLWTNYWAAVPIGTRDLLKTSPQGVGTLAFYHPTMQETLLAAARDAGAEVRRGVKATGLALGRPPTVTLDASGVVQQQSAKLVVGADGRNSRVRKWAGMTTRSDPPRLIVASVLLEKLDVLEDRVHVFFPPAFGEMLLVFPIGQQRFRLYFVYQKEHRDRRLSGAQQYDALVDGCVELGIPRTAFRETRMIGPLAAFDAADTWVEQPYAEGVVVLGDAGTANDPSWGSGLSLTLRDARVLRDELLNTDDWDAATARFAARHQEYYAALHRLESWVTRLFFDFGPEADVARVRALPKLMFGGGPDLVGLGPESPSDEAARRELFGDSRDDVSLLYWLAGRQGGLALLARLARTRGALQALSAASWCGSLLTHAWRRIWPKAAPAATATSSEVSHPA